MRDEMSMGVKGLNEIVVRAWSGLLKDYASGEVLLVTEADMERHFTYLCLTLLKEVGQPPLAFNQDRQGGRRVDVRLGSQDEPVIVQLKLYRDQADWKETATMRNTVESDLRFVEAKANAWAGIIDTIPSTSRPPLPFNLEWKDLMIDGQVLEAYYGSKATSLPSWASPRERLQRSCLANGSQLRARLLN